MAVGMMVDSLFNAMATAAFFEFVIFAVFEMRYMLNIWKSRQGNLIDSRTQQRELLGLYARFYFALLCSIFISYQAQGYGPVLTGSNRECIHDRCNGYMTTRQTVIVL